MSRLEAAISAINATVTDPADSFQQLIAAKCRALMAGYEARWGHLQYEVLAVEQMVKSDLYNPGTKGKSRSFTVAGKLDVIAKYEGRRTLIDHKSTSNDISDPNAPYFRQLAVEGQASHYMLLEWLNGRKVDQAVWDVMRKPGISPKNLTKADQQSLSITKFYFGREMSAESLAECRSTGRETYEMYEARLAHDCTVERPNWYFARRTIPRMDHEISEYAGELWDLGQEMLHTRNTDRHLRNSGSCMQYNSPCKFLGICSNYDSPDSENWKPKATVHAELPLLDGDGKDVITNSRIRSFQTCKRKHFYDYELGIERIDEEEREALYFGNVWHVGQEAWWAYGLPTNEAAFIGQSELRSEPCLA